MLRQITNAIFGSSQSTLEAEMAIELGQILKRGTLKEKLLSVGDLAVFQEFPISLDTKISLLISHIRDAYQLPAIIYEIQYQDDKPIISIASDLITEDNYKTVIALCARFELDIVSSINDKKRTCHPFDQFDIGLVEVIISYMDDFSKYAFWQDPLFRDSVLGLEPTEQWLKHARELDLAYSVASFETISSHFEATAKADFAKASWFKGNIFRMKAAMFGATIGLAGMSVSGYFIGAIRATKQTLLKKLEGIAFVDHYGPTNCVSRYRIQVDLIDRCSPAKAHPVYQECVDPCDKFYKQGLLMLAPGFGFSISALLTVCSLYLIGENSKNREYYLGKFNASEYSPETKKAADLLIAEAKNIIDQKRLPEMHEGTEVYNYYLTRLVQMNSSATPIGDVLGVARGIRTCTHARVQEIMQRLQADPVPPLEQKALAISVLPEAVSENSASSDATIDIPSDSEIMRLPRPFIFARLGGFRPEVTQRLLGNEEDKSLSFQLP